MHVFKPVAFTAATTQHTQTPRLCYTIRAENGFLAANHANDGPPIRVIASPEHATRFVDITSAGRRAAALQQLGWRDLRIIAVYLPLIRL